MATSITRLGATWISTPAQGIAVDGVLFPPREDAVAPGIQVGLAGPHDVRVIVGVDELDHRASAGVSQFEQLGGDLSGGRRGDDYFFALCRHPAVHPAVEALLARHGADPFFRTARDTHEPRVLPTDPPESGDRSHVGVPPCTTMTLFPRCVNDFARYARGVS